MLGWTHVLAQVQSERDAFQKTEGVLPHSLYLGIVGIVPWVQTAETSHYMLLYVNICYMLSNYIIICIYMCIYTHIYLMYIYFVFTAVLSRLGLNLKKICNYFGFCNILFVHINSKLCNTY